MSNLANAKDDRKGEKEHNRITLEEKKCKHSTPFVLFGTGLLVR